ncbi:MAG: glycoside hydrolase family 32 protein [Chloroflexota bacterium]|nr:glycoside hydrolase family 32 protein [Chloroflexota bacterium]
MSVDQRPLHHITPEIGWLNDPNGLVWHDGRYHVFHQANPRGVWFGRMEWGHLSSPDLVRWTRHPTAIAPSAGPDGDGSWSGCVVLDHGRPVAVYTGVNSLGVDMWTQTVCLARGDAALMQWQKDPRNPVISGPPGELKTIGFRDPFLRQDSDGWRMIIGTGIASRGGAILQFRSQDLVSWTYEGVVFERDATSTDPIWTGRIFECPQLVPLGDRELLVFSVWDDERPPVLHYVVAGLGRFEGHAFEPDRLARFDHGADLYAPALMVDPRGRILAWGWSWEALTPAGRKAQGWAGCLTFPRELFVAADGSLGARPAAELVALRGRRGSAGPFNLQSAEPWTAESLRGDALEIAVRIEDVEARCVNLILRASPDLTERTVVRYDRSRGRVEIDRDAASSSPEALQGVHGGPLDVAPGEALDLRVLVDKSIVEVFANDRLVITERIYPTRPDSLGVSLVAEGGGARVANIDWWPLNAGVPGNG